MRGADETSGSLFSYVDLEARIPARHPLRQIRRVVNDALARALLQKGGLRREGPFPLQVQATRTISAVGSVAQNG